MIEGWVLVANGGIKPIKDCGFARIAHTILVDEQRADQRKMAARKLSPARLAGVLELPLSSTYALLAGSQALNPTQARTTLTYTGDIRLAHWLLHDSPFVPALRPAAITIPPRLTASLPAREDARLHASAHAMMREAYSLLMGVLDATSDRVVDEVDRANLGSELSDLESAVATLRLVVDGATIERSV
jgi:hypothetical protein